MIFFPQGQPTQPETFDEYCANGGYVALRKDLAPNAIIQEVATSGLRGRGGAGFPVGRKWSIAAETDLFPRYVVCNAGEDEPGSFKDRVLMEHRPHMILEGILLTARAVGAEQAYVYINETYDYCHARMSDAIGEAQKA